MMRSNYELFNNIDQLQRYAFEMMTEHIRRKDYGFIARFMQNMPIGTPTQQSYFAQLYAEQEQVRLAEDARQKLEGEPPKDCLLLPPGATMADLVTALKAAPEKVEKFFYRDLQDNFEDYVPDFADIMMGKEEVPEMTVADFFRLNAEDLEQFLPIRFWAVKKG